MGMKPIVKPKSLKRKPVTEVPTLGGWKERWEITHSNPVPLGNPWSRQPLDYYAKRQLFSKKMDRRQKYEVMTPDITTVIPNMPDIIGQITFRGTARLVGRLNPIISTIMIIDDVKTLYNMLK